MRGTVLHRSRDSPQLKKPFVSSEMRRTLCGFLECVPRWYWDAERWVCAAIVALIGSDQSLAENSESKWCTVDMISMLMRLLSDMQELQAEEPSRPQQLWALEWAWEALYRALSSVIKQNSADLAALSSDQPEGCRPALHPIPAVLPCRTVRLWGCSFGDGTAPARQQPQAAVRVFRVS